MLRYFYILISFSVCFCYKYTNENRQNEIEGQNENGESKKQTEKSKVVQFDVASFIRNSVGGNSKDYEPYVNRIQKRNHRRIPSDDYYDYPFNKTKRDKNADYLNVENDSKDDSNDSDQIPKDEERIDPHDPYEEVKRENSVFDLKNKITNRQNELTVDTDNIINPEKKCSFRDMKVPFFFHRPKTAKRQKRKLVCFNCAQTNTSNAKSGANNNLKKISSKIQRTYGYLCPKCVRKLLKRYNEKKKKKPNKIGVHNSREFFQKMGTTVAQDKNPNHKSSKAHFDDYLIYNNARIKRDEIRERQLKELAEVEKKVEEVVITSPMFTNMPMIHNTLNSKVLE